MSTPIISNFVDNFRSLSNYPLQTLQTLQVPQTSNTRKGNGEETEIQELELATLQPRSVNNGKTAIIFDWDDTLLPKFLLPYIGSIHLNASVPSIAVDIEDEAEAAIILGVDIKQGIDNGALVLDLEQLQELAKLDELIFDIFTRILGDPQLHLYLVTNSKSGWIELSSKKFLPQVHNFIAKHNNDRDHFFVISARSTYESIYPGDPIAWKVATFDKITGATKPSQLISLGDGIPEKQATDLVSKKYAIPGKSVQFLSDPPTIAMLVDQLELVDSELDKVCAYPESFAFSIVSPE